MIMVNEVKPYNHRTYEDLSADLSFHETEIDESRTRIPPMDEGQRIAHIFEADRLRNAVRRLLLKEIL